ncbi:MAG: extracellular solute-binding protein [Bacillota bacterium]
MMRTYPRVRVSRWWSVWVLLVLIPSLLVSGCATTSKETNGTSAQAPGSDGVQTVTFSVMVVGKPTERYRLENLKAAAERLNKKLEQEGQPVRVRVEGKLEDRPWEEYKQKFILASEAGKAPDIVLSGHEDVAPWSEAGHIIALDEYVRNNPVYQELFPNLWEAVTYKGKIWGIPQDVEARPLYFWKSLLKKAGWSDADIEALPDRIRSGAFTLDDLLKVAKDLQDKGAVEPAMGFWTRPQPGPDFYLFYFAYGGEMYDAESGKLVLDRQALLNEYRFFARAAQEDKVMRPTLIGTDWSIWHRTVMGQKVGFFHGGSWQVAEWKDKYGLTDDKMRDLGYALIPSGEKGRPGVTLSHPLVYMVTAQSKHPELAARLLIEATAPDLNTRHAVESGHLAILKSQLDDPEYRKSGFLHSVSYMVEHAKFLPLHSQFGTYDQAVYRGLTAVVAGQMTPEVAVETVVKQLQGQLKDEVIIR